MSRRLKGFVREREGDEEKTKRIDETKIEKIRM